LEDGAGLLAGECREVDCIRGGDPSSLRMKDLIGYFVFIIGGNVWLNEKQPRPETGAKHLRMRPGLGP